MKLLLLLLCIWAVVPTQGVLRWKKFVPTGDIPTDITNGVVEFNHDRTLLS